MIPFGETVVNRNVHCLLGLPIDALTMDEAVQRVRQAALGNLRCFVSTPNLNFAMGARLDSEFRDSVLHSDLSLADGMPLVWVARFLGIPVRERVSGAGLFERLQAHPGEPLTVFFFGGPPGAAEAAGLAINAAGGGLKCVGFESPGFGSLEDMSGDGVIDKINESAAMFVIVSLGAKKGQRWIEMNRHRLRAPVLCHLGAVVNFAAGTVQRAPGWVQRLGGEWLWRVYQEPGLWSRYWNDGRAFLAVLVREVLPLRLEQWTNGLRGTGTPPTLDINRGGGRTTLSLVGAWDGRCIEPLQQALMGMHETEDALTVDLQRTERVGSAVLGLLLLAKGAFANEGRFEICHARPRVARTFVRSGVAHLLSDRH